MSENEVQHSSTAQRAAQELAWQVAKRVVAAKGSVVIALVVAVVALVTMLALACGVAGAIFQSSTAPWPAPLAEDEAGGYRASGWHVTSRFGWREHPLTPGVAEFHDGVDLAGPAFCLRCPVVSLFDATVAYVGWDDPSADAPETAGGGQVVVIESGDEDYQALYAHLEPYRLYVQLQGRIDDPYGRYDDYASYAPVGEGELRPDGEVAIVCAGERPTFRASRVGTGTILFVYDRPASCRTRVIWGERGGGWRGWNPDGVTELRWQTPIEEGVRAGDIALRFQAHLVPPPPPPTRTPVIGTPALRGSNIDIEESGESPSGSCVADRCTWSLAAIPEARPVRAAGTVWQGSAPRRPEAWAQNLDATATPTATHEPAGSTLPTTTSEPTAQPLPAILMVAVPQQVAVGGQFTYVVGFASDSIVDQRVRATITLDPRVEVLGVEPGPASCASGSGGFVCQATVRRGQMVQARVIVRVRPGSSRTGDIVAGLSATAGGETVVAQPVRVVLLNEVVTPAPWPPPTAGPTSTPGWEGPTDGPVPTAAAPRSTGAPCLGAVLAAVSRQGARYSQGGALENDPLGTDGLPLPRTGPRSFDCSGLVWWAYAQAGVAIGSTTAQQINDGVMIACSLDDLRGAATRCWAPGDLIFLRSDIGRHVAIYAGDGLFMDCFNHRVGCVLHDVSQDSFYRAHFWQARRVVSGCEGMTLDPGEPVPPPLDGTPVGDAPGMCVAEPPSFGSPIEELSGCGPPVRLGGRVYQLDSTVGFVGVTGLTTGPHLHLGLRMRSYDGTIPQTNICTEPWLQGRVPPPGVSCWTEMADPLDFLPRALGGETTAGGTPIPEGAPYQLPPPGHPGALAMTPVPGATPVGQYWSPHPDGGRYGGGSALEWLRDAVCSVWRGGPLCN